MEDAPNQLELKNHSSTESGRSNMCFNLEKCTRWLTIPNTKKVSRRTSNTIHVISMM